MVGPVCLGGLVLAALYVATVQERPQPSVSVAPLTVALTAYVGNCSIAAAAANGDFDAERLRVAVRLEPTGRDALTAVLERRADLATVADVPIMFAALAEKPVSVIATIATGTRDHGIVGARGKGISVPGDLRGKRIALPVGTSAHFFLDAFLNRQKMASGDVTLVDLAPEELTGALATGDVDTIAVWQPFLSAAAESLGDSGSVFYGEGVYDVMYNLAVTRDAASTRPSELARFLRAVARGAQFCRDAPAAAQRAVAQLTGLDRARVEALWPAYSFRVGLHQALLLALEDEARWATTRKLGTAPAVQNFLDHLEFEPLRAAAPASVTVIH